MSKTKRVIRPERVNSQGECTIYILYTHRSKNTYISTKEQINIKDWDCKEGIAKRSHRGYSNLNNFIEGIQATIDEIKREIIREKMDPDVSIVKEKYIERNEPIQAVTKDFFCSLDEFINYKEYTEQQAISTIKQYKTFRSHLKEFDNQGRKRLNFSLINMQFYNNYLDYLIDDKDLSTNTVGAQIKQLKVFMNWCLESNRSNNNEFKKFKKPSAETNIVALTKEEFDTLFEHEFNNPRLEKVRDEFIFSCTTGLRFSDYSRVNKDKIIDNQIVIHAKKTGEELRIPIHDYAKSILEKYNYELSSVSIQKTNVHLKTMAKEAGLNNLREMKNTKGRNTTIEQQPLHKIISTHVGRKTFITIMLDQGHPFKDVMKLSGHKKLS